MKKLFAVLLACMMVLGLGACSNTTSTGDGEKTEVVIWHTYTADQQAYIDEVVAAFNAEHENIEVVVETQPRQDFESKVMNAVRAGNGPDIIIHYATEAANYVDEGLVADIGAYINDEEIGIADYESTVDKGAWDEANSFSDGKMHIFPLITSGPVFFYNADIYDELGLSAPATWAELEENSRAIKEAYPEKYGFAFDSLTDGGQTLISQTGNEIVDPETKTVTFNTEEVVEQVEWYANCVKEGLFMQSPTADYFSGDFNSGLLASYIGSVAGVPYLELENWAVAPLPQGGEVEWTPAWNRGAIIFSSDEATERAAFEFVKYFASPEVNAEFCKVANYASPYAATREQEVYQEHISGNEALNALRPETAGSFPAIPGVATVRTQVEQMFTEAANDMKDAATAVADAEARCNEALAG